MNSNLFGPHNHARITDAQPKSLGFSNCVIIYVFEASPLRFMQYNGRNLSQIYTEFEIFVPTYILQVLLS